MKKYTVKIFCELTWRCIDQKDFDTLEDAQEYKRKIENGELIAMDLFGKIIDNERVY
jgi:hypothetical protein